ncbi:kinase-like domain-containing protein [Leucosporidium creatinivorum]|uniref:Kinase-like domain-containing protein n=1 Tax=Leucosporidium creatinivorum TaxID=106004 RepID=A0A1Y2BYA4_9BASI|nr:kinase-like domain-containing protein [Leucosporidium creatinivorum]
MITNKSYDGNERMRISVVREVEVLKNIRHPSLVSLSASFSTPIYTVLVLDYAPGGELFDFLAQWHTSVEEPLARRIFGELCSAVGWMHSIGLVHRDIKLENILLTSRPFPSSTPSNVLASLPTPFVKLTDFGLSRFISPTNPTLSTRCGSEAYAAPELIMGRKYDGRKTDAWALGVVLFAIITGVMPFVEEPEGAKGKGRRGYLLKIAKGEYRWPALNDDDSARLVSPSVKALAARLLVRDPEKRAKVDDVWESEWMQGDGRPERVDGFVEPVREGEQDLRATWVRRGSGM